MIVALVMFFLGADEITVLGETTEVSLLPAPLDIVFGLVGFLLIIVLLIAIFLTLVYIIVATVKAISGSTWTYPGAIAFVERYR
ncbi:acyltransferase [Haloterrigena salina JCM 13891]|uniref:Acyltransferase n=2 Tax=Haloterrigena salina TaxID=504937 RepID=M0CM74_9EURY|nr:acyltransferase [Haloterrigena salina JCM 13891]